MSSRTLQDLMRQVDELSIDEQLDLLAYIAEQARKNTKRPRWGDIYGITPDIMEGEDAQEWVTRTRKESTNHREALLGQ